MPQMSSSRRRSHPPCPLALLAFTLFVPFAGFAQDASTAAIRGTVSDATGSRIAGANLVITNTATDLRRATVTDAQGCFAVDLLPPGDYSVRAIASGMTSATRARQHVEVGGVLLLDFPLPSPDRARPSRWKAPPEKSRPRPAASPT